MQFFWGMFLADLSTCQQATEYIQSHRYIRTVVSPLLIFIGLFVASYPDSRAEWMAWSNALSEFSKYILPDKAGNPRFYSGIGLDFISLGIIFSNQAKEFFSHRWLLFLGKNSFATYLLHGTMIKTVLLYGIADCWTVWVDPMCGRWTTRLEKLAFAEDVNTTLPLWISRFEERYKR